jgi:hypothetical protein
MVLAAGRSEGVSQNLLSGWLRVAAVHHTANDNSSLPGGHERMRAFLRRFPTDRP